MTDYTMDETLDNITGNPVTGHNFLKTRLFLVDNLKQLLRTCSVNIVAPRRFGKTSVIKELVRQEACKGSDEQEFNILFFELEGEESVKSIYGGMLKMGNHDFNHYHSRLEDYLFRDEKKWSEILLKQLCHGAMDETELYEVHLSGLCNVEQFQTIANRLVYEGYITRDTGAGGKLRFVAPILKDWWGCKKGVNHVRL